MARFIVDESRRQAVTFEAVTDCDVLYVIIQCRVELAIIRPNDQECADAEGHPSLKSFVRAARRHV